jgi:DnaK suppressor protein
MTLKDEYLTDDQLTTLKGILDEQLTELMGQSKEALDELVEVRELDADPLDLAVTESNREFMLRFADRERQLVKKILLALNRVKAGEYGTCESCGSEIGFGRLMARPVATLCIDCKTEAEQLETRKKVF